MATISIAQAKAYAVGAGFSGSSLNIAVAIAMAESSLRTDARNINNDQWHSIDRGLWQINSHWHPEVSDAQAYDAAGAARAAYRISSGGVNFNPWSTFGNGAYTRYLDQVGAGGGVAQSPVTAPNVKQGASNAFPMGQCTWWADERYHQLSGYYVPWNGNAATWLLGATANGWQTGNVPPKGIASIVVLQPGVQGASSVYGHVGTVEKANGDGSAVVSNMNWSAGPTLSTVSGYPIRQSTIQPGPGVSFVWASDTTLTGGAVTPSTVLGSIAKSINLAPNASVTAALITLDETLKIKNPFDIDTASMQDSVAGVASFTDPVQWLNQLGINLMGDVGAIMIRLLLIILGLFLLYKVISRFVDFVGIAQGATGNAQSLLQALAPLLLAA